MRDSVCVMKSTQFKYNPATDSLFKAKLGDEYILPDKTLNPISNE